MLFFMVLNETNLKKAKDLFEEYEREQSLYSTFEKKRFKKTRSRFNDMYKNNSYLDSSFFLIENVENETIGFISALRINKNNNDSNVEGWTWIITDFYVKPENRRKGYGTQIIKHFIKYHLKNTYEIVVRFYTKFTVNENFLLSAYKKLDLFPIPEPDFVVDKFYDAEQLEESKIMYFRIPEDKK